MTYLLLCSSWGSILRGLHEIGLVGGSSRAFSLVEAVITAWDFVFPLKNRLAK